ncbi:enterochelin esterase [Steroidobacter agaridevorans]|uniref:Enterochelin esterase n=1 Tax=Steroidobacter agaridevorans TaxID=2695856 RepID=A0A829YPA6_9GAMM|nr:alpha/beta hydrolase-fold protein [Steroidobacter agaridevorans]GFE84662.1 enterochelin esterase [Steroidobacter agaridevorans]
MMSRTLGGVRGCVVAAAGVVALLTMLASTGAERVERDTKVTQLDATQPVSGTLAAGTSQRFSFQADAGAFVHGLVDTQMVQGLTGAILDSKGEVLRKFAGGIIAFVAPKRDSYELRLTNAGSAESAFRLSISVVRPLDPEVASASELISPKLQQHSAGLAAGTTTSDTFWRSIAANGTPLIEHVGDDVLVTFLWRGTSQTRQVKVLWSLFHIAPVIELRQLGRSDIWYRSFKFAPGTRFEYSVAENPPVVAGPPMVQAMALVATAQGDPLHGDSRGRNPAELFASRSRVELPPVLRDSEWTQAREGVKRGKTETFQIGERRISVYTPPGYSQQCGPYPLLLLLDGSAYQGLIPVPTILENLLAARRIAPTIAVFVDNASVASRSTDMYPNDEFTDLIATQLIKQVRAKYSVTKEPRHTVIGGFSLGGLAAANIAWRHPETFGAVLSQSGAFWWSEDAIKAGRGEPILTEGPLLDPRIESFELVKRIAKAPKAPIRLHLTAGLYEGDLLTANRFLRDVLTAKGNEVEYHEFPGGHDGAFWRAAFADAYLSLAAASPSSGSQDCYAEQVLSNASSKP